MTGNPFRAPMPNRDTAEWWAALRRRELLLQRCAGCGRLRWPPRAICNDCGCLDREWLPSAGTGTVASWTVTRRPPAPQLDVPFTVLLVRLDDQDDVFVPGGWAGAPDGIDLTIGLAVEIGYHDLPAPEGDAATVIRWQGAAEGATTTFGSES